MYCVRCGRSDEKNNKFCVHCGAPIVGINVVSQPTINLADKGLETDASNFVEQDYNESLNQQQKSEISFPKKEFVETVCKRADANIRLSSEIEDLIYGKKYSEDDRLLLVGLVDLRTLIKDYEKAQTGRAPKVCGDEALIAMVDKKPVEIGHLKAIEGVGTIFIDKYGELFIDVVKALLPDEKKVKAVSVTAVANNVLKELEKKLVQINKLNKLLYLSKLSPKMNLDLYANREIDFGRFLLRTQGIIKLSAYDPSSPMYKAVVALSREVNKAIREKGQNDLYIGYPFVMGKIPNENFDVRCPLALFPVVICKSEDNVYSLKNDSSRDAIYNNTLILAYNKFNCIQKPLPTDTIEDYDHASFLDSIVDYYAEQGISIAIRDRDNSKFLEYKKDSFPKQVSGSFFLDNNAVLGRFPVYTSSLQKDYDAIIADGKISALLNELILEANERDYEGEDSFFSETKTEPVNDKYEVTEKDLTYITELDGAQEKVLTAVERLDTLVIQGPPGTGKSQTITSLIADFVNKGKTVLMVSEKKTALDVVYSRLGELSQYALLIDDANNKDLFYGQLSDMFKATTKVKSNDAEISSVTSDIDSKIGRLQELAAKLHTKSQFGVEPYKLYLTQKRYDDNDQFAKSKLDSMHRLITGQLKRIDYSELTEIRDKFSNYALLNSVNTYFKIIGTFPWIKQANRKINEIELNSLFMALDDIKSDIEENNAQKIFKKTMGRFAIKKKAKKFVKKYFVNVSKDLVLLVVDNVDVAFDGFRRYLDYIDSYTKYSQLSANEVEYITAVHSLSNDETRLLEDNYDFYNTILYEHIVEFEDNNRVLLQTIGDYVSIVNSISSLISQKKKLTKDKLTYLLNENMKTITFGKRGGEMQRIVEGKRRRSVNRFISEYNYEMFNGIKIWMLTPEVVSEIIPLREGLFDLVIFDEASQMFLEKGLPAIERAKKVVIAGDHKQLRPTNIMTGRYEIDEDALSEDDELNAALEEESLLDLARFKYQDIMLNYHYRSRYEELISFSNYAFYGGRLNISPNIDAPEVPPIEFHLMKNALWVNRSNRVEALKVVELLKDIMYTRMKDETIGVIAFNSSQRDLIEDILDEECARDPEFSVMVNKELSRKENGEDRGLFIKNVESVQGDERDIIIFSIGYAYDENGRLVRNYGWLNRRGGENRLNVAVSRAKQKIHIVASFEPKELQVEDLKNDGPRYLKKYLIYAKAVSDGDRLVAKDILASFGDQKNPGEEIRFDSDFENQVFDALNYRLEGTDIRVDTQVGIGGYSIDLALKRDGEYILGIECDGKTYHSSKSARERDYHRQKYLESRGWKIHRIWSTNWWKNPTKEIDMICDLINEMQ